MNGCQSSMAMLIDNCLLIGGLLDESVARGTREVDRRKQLNAHNLEAIQFYLHAVTLF